MGAAVAEATLAIRIDVAVLSVLTENAASATVDVGFVAVVSLVTARGALAHATYASSTFALGAKKARATVGVLRKCAHH